MTNPHDKAIEAAAKAVDPDLFSDDPVVAHRAASPFTVEAARKPVIDDLTRAIAAYERAMCGEPAAWRYKSEAPGGHSEWSVTQSRADLDTLSKMPFMRVEPLYVLPPVPEGEE